MAEFKDTFLTYKRKPLVRCGKTIYYGDMADPFVACLQIQSDKEFKDIKLSDKVLVQSINTDPQVGPKEKIVKKSEKEGIFNALDLGAVWLQRELKK